MAGLGVYKLDNGESFPTNCFPIRSFHQSKEGISIDTILFIMQFCTIMNYSKCKNMETNCIAQCLQYCLVIKGKGQRWHVSSEYWRDLGKKHGLAYVVRLKLWKYYVPHQNKVSYIKHVCNYKTVQSEYYVNTSLMLLLMLLTWTACILKNNAVVMCLLQDSDMFPILSCMDENK